MHMLYAHTGMHTYKHHTFRHAHNAIRVALHTEKASVALSHWLRKLALGALRRELKL